MNYTEPKAQYSGQIGAMAQCIERDISPVAQRLCELGQEIEIAHDTLTALADRLAPVRNTAISGTAGSCKECAPDGCELESKLSNLVDGVASLNRRLASVTSELRI